MFTRSFLSFGVLWVLRRKCTLSNILSTEDKGVFSPLVSTTQRRKGAFQSRVQGQKAASSASMTSLDASPHTPKERVPEFPAERAQHLLVFLHHTVSYKTHAYSTCYQKTYQMVLGNILLVLWRTSSQERTGATANASMAASTQEASPALAACSLSHLPHTDYASQTTSFLCLFGDAMT